MLTVYTTFAFIENCESWSIKHRAVVNWTIAEDKSITFNMADYFKKKRKFE